MVEYRLNIFFIKTRDSFHSEKEEILFLSRDFLSWNIKWRIYGKIIDKIITAYNTVSLQHRVQHRANLDN